MRYKYLLMIVLQAGSTTAAYLEKRPRPIIPPLKPHEGCEYLCIPEAA
jgi:hypothetical protein